MVNLVEVARELKPTTPLYWENSYLQRFEAQVTRFVEEKKRNLYLVLDKTAFHPKSGGQPSDKGLISGPDFEFQVKKVMLQRGVIIHWGKVLKGKPSEIRVTGEIDWGWRHLLMKRHTAGHLLDHCLYEKTGKPVETTDSWLGEGCYVGYRGEAPGKEVLDGIEALANDLISRGKKVYVENISHQDLLKRAPMAPNRFRLPKFESYRVVFIDGFELIPCGGTHLKDIREIGSVHLEGSERGEATYKIYYDVGE